MIEIALLAEFPQLAPASMRNFAEVQSVQHRIFARAAEPLEISGTKNKRAPMGAR
jgi:hypothetical protein